MIQVASVFPWKPFTIWGSNLGYHITIINDASLGTSCLWQCFRCSLFLMTFLILRITSQECCKISLRWEFSIFFFPSGLNYYMCVFGKTAEVKCHFHQISRVHAICMTVDINHLARVAFASFSTFLPLFPYRTFGKKVVMHSPHLEQGIMFSVFKNGVSA